MGSIGAALMQTLGVGGQTPPQTTAPMVGEDNSPSAIAQLIGNAYPPDVQAPQGNLPSQGGPPPETQAVVHGFKAKEPSFLGRMADAFLVERGAKPVYGPKKDEDNMMRAMEGFTQDPMEAIRRIAQIPGHQEQALQLYNQIIDNQRSQGTLDRQNKAFDLKIEEIARDRVASMLGAVQPGDSAGYAKMRERALAYGQAKGFDFSNELPEDGGQFDTDAFRYGEVPVAKQMQLEDARTYRGQVLDERRGYHNTTAGISQERVDEYERHNGVQENKPRGGGPVSNEGKAYKDQNGVLIEYGKNGGMKATSPSGTVSWYKLDVNGKKVLIARKTKEQIVAEAEAAKQ